SSVPAGNRPSSIELEDDDGGRAFGIAIVAAADRATPSDNAAPQDRQKRLVSGTSELHDAQTSMSDLIYHGVCEYSAFACTRTGRSESPKNYAPVIQNPLEFRRGFGRTVRRPVSLAAYVDRIQTSETVTQSRSGRRLRQRPPWVPQGGVQRSQPVACLA